MNAQERRTLRQKRSAGHRVTIPKTSLPQNVPADRHDCRKARRCNRSIIPFDYASSKSESLPSGARVLQ
jgi:hypothetical protein